MASLTDEIQYIKLYTLRPLILHFYLLPFIPLYVVWLYGWVVLYGVKEYFEAGLIVLAIIGCLQILSGLFCHWSVHVRSFFTCSSVNNPSKATIIKVVPTPNNGSAELLNLHHDKEKDTGQDVIWFRFQKAKYIYDSEEKKTFCPVDFPINETFEYYQNWKGYQEEEILIKTRSKYGKNQLDMDVPSFMELFKERATAPFFVFQVFCVGLWCLDEYWYYSLFTLFMLVAFEATLVQQQMKNMKEIRNMGTKPYLIQVYRNRKWRPILSNELLPGDIVSIGRPKNADTLIPCDLLLLRGSCIVDEAMLTGESVPQMKESIEDMPTEDVFDLDVHSKLHLLSGGTKVVQHSPPLKTATGIKAPDNGSIGYVLRTGFNTSQGKLLKTILFGVKRVTANNLETFLFIVFLLIFAVTAASYVWIKGTEDPNRNRYKLFLECTLILTSVVPPELPIELSLAVNSSLIALQKLAVYCTEPFRIPFAGKIDICCFDKTGTLTSDNLVVQGVAGLKKDDEISTIDEIPEDTLHVLASCHSLVCLEDSLVGDPLEKAVLHAVDWRLTKGDLVIPNKGRRITMRINHRYHFSSALKRMSTVVSVQTQGSTTSNYFAAVKGAPETLRKMYNKVPENYDFVYNKMTCQGARVLALGFKKLGELSAKEVRDLTREEVESELEFVGFVIIACPLKSDSKNVIKQVLESSHHVTMITGDNPLTACHVAKELRITRKETLVLTHSSSITNHSVEDEWHWEPVDGSFKLPLIPQSGPRNFTSKHDLCLTGEAFSYLYSHSHTLKFLESILPCVRVFARVSPKQKELVVTKLKDMGYVTLMCGDGTNDVGALKHAHCGVALLSGAPEHMNEKKSKNKDKEENTKHTGSDSRGDKEKSNDITIVSRSRVNASQARGTSRAAKMRAVARGEDTAGKPDPQKKLQEMLKEIDEMDGNQIVQLGDACIASPFTSKLSSINCVCHIIKQGRCTLVTTLQMFKILALNALILAYSQSVLYLDGIKFSDGQATLQGVLLAGCFLFISRSKPLKVLSKQRPLPNIFNIYTIVTVLLQFAVHFMALFVMVQEAKRLTPSSAAHFVNLESKFEPTILNSTVYIISIALQLLTFAINYKGHPFMESLVENKPLIYSLLASGGFVVLLIMGQIPEVAQQFEIVPFPQKFREKFIYVLAADIVAVYLLDRILEFLFGSSKLKKP